VNVVVKNTRVDLTARAQDFSKIQGAVALCPNLIIIGSMALGELVESDRSFK
jgi:hypothetical protein